MRRLKKYGEGGWGYRFVDKVDSVFLCVEKYNSVTKLNSYQLKVY